MIYIKKLIHRFRICKYHNCVNGIIFATFGIACLLWGFSIIYGNGNKGGYLIALPFVGIVVCLIFGLRSMLHNHEYTKPSKEICTY